MTAEELIEKAWEARKASYSPYSKFKVGAALLTKDGQVFTGCNIENAGYSATNCAERTAFFKAVSEGKKEFQKIAIIGGFSLQESGQGEKEVQEYTAPCGVCRQVMMEFCEPKTFEIIIAKSAYDYKTFTLEQLFPMGFGPGNL